MNSSLQILQNSYKNLGQVRIQEKVLSIQKEVYETKKEEEKKKRERKGKKS
jgi:hypothetical protein